MRGHTWPDGVTIDVEPEKDHIWAAVEVFAEDLELEDHRPPHPERELWYTPTVIIKDAYRADALFQAYGIERVYDLGAGDCRFALWCDRRGYDVVAYELNDELADAVEDRFWLGDLELRRRDYYEDFDDLVAPDAAVVAFGDTNELPYVPDEGLAIHGFFENPLTAWFDGEVVARW